MIFWPFVYNFDLTRQKHAMSHESEELLLIQQGKTITDGFYGREMIENIYLLIISSLNSLVHILETCGMLGL